MSTTSTTYESLETAFRHRNFKPLYFLYGEEAYLIDRLQKHFLDNALAPHERDFNQDIVYGSEADAQAVLALCASYPMMAERRVVVVRRFDELKNNELFTSYAAAPNPMACVLLVCNGKPKMTAHPYRALREHAVSVELKPLYPNHVPGWIQKHVQSLGHQIDPDAASMLADFVGTSLRTAAAEVDKLITFTGGRKRLTADDVVQAGGQTREYNVFELQKAIGEGRSYDAVRIAERMLQQASNKRSEAIMVVSVLTAYFMKLWKLGAAGDTAHEGALAARIGVSPFFVKEYVAAYRRMGNAFVEKAFDALLSADFELKGGAERDERLILLLLMRRLVPATAQAA